MNNRGVLPEIDDKELVARKGDQLVCDLEIYDNYFLAMFRFHDGKLVYFEGTKFNQKKLLWILENFEIITFNGINFDIPILLYILYKVDFTTEELKLRANEIISGGLSPYRFYKKYKIPTNGVRINHIDIKEVLIGQSSLKTYAGRVHAPYMQDLPYEEWEILDTEMKDNVLRYCVNDCINTKVVMDDRAKDFDLRRQLSIQYSADVRSKSDAQIAEVVLRRELEWRHGVRCVVPDRPDGHSFKYQIPDNLSFKTKQMQDVLEIVRNENFYLWNGKVALPQSLKDLKIEFDGTVYRMGIGGLHSTEEAMTNRSGNEYRLIDRDVASYYPMIILNQQLYPKHLGKSFLTAYRGIVERRLEAKAAGDKSTANTLKIVINGSFGKFGSEYSFLFSPELLIQTTVSGQLYLLMLIEALHLAGVVVVSGNTDGIVSRVKYGDEEKFLEIVEEWERVTGFTTEETEYKALYSRDVNSYIAIMEDGNVKSKGAFAESGISKNPSGDIINDAVRAYLKDGTPVEETIEGCTDIRKFVFIRKVNGGCEDFDRNPIGKVIRYYLKKGQFHPLFYSTNRHRVPKTAGAYPIMDLTIDFPQDIDYGAYSHEAKKIIREQFSKPEQFDLFG